MRGSWGHIRVVVLIHKSLPFVFSYQGLEHGVLLAVISEVLRDEEALHDSFDLEVSSSPGFEHQPLVRVGGLSPDVLEERTSSDFSLLMHNEVIHGLSLLEDEISLPLIDELLVVEVEEWLKESLQNTFLVVVVRDVVHVLIVVVVVPLPYGPKGSGSAQRSSVNDSLV